MKQLQAIYDMAKKIIEALHAEHTQEAVKDILGITDELSDTVKIIFGMAKDAADDVVEIAFIVSETLEKISDDEGTSRAVTKPVTEMSTREDVVNTILASL